MLESNTKVTLTVADARLGDTGEWKTVGEIKASVPVIRSADHHGRADRLYKGTRKKYEPVELSRVCGDWDWDHKSAWLALASSGATVTELVFDEDGLPYGKGLVVTGQVTSVAFPKRDRDSEQGLANITVTIEPTEITEA